MNNLALSIITPSFNQGRFIERTLTSVLDQGIDSLDYIVCDGGSTDDTLGILRKYDGRIRWLSEKDRGQTHAINKGLAMTRGDIVAYLNSDDIYYPGALAAVLKYFQDHPEIGVVYGNANHIDENDAVLESYYTQEWDFERFTDVCFLCQPSVFWRRAVTDTIGPFNESLQFCMDYEYWIKLAQAGVSFGYIRETLAGSRMYSENKTMSATRRVHAEINDMLKDRLGKVPDSWLFNIAHAYLDSWGMKRNTRLFARCVSLLSLWAALKWNHAVTRNMQQTLRQWNR